MSSVVTLETLGSESNSVTIPLPQEPRHAAVALEAPAVQPQPVSLNQVDLFGPHPALLRSLGMPYAPTPLVGDLWFPELGGLPVEPDEIPWDFTDQFNDGDVVTEGQVESVDADAGRLLSMPVNGRATSRFGMRFHPILRVWKLHTGHDWAASCGAPVGAAAPGVVTRAGWAGGNGIQVRVDHGQIAGRHVVTTYNHLSAIGVRLGQQVATGQGVGRVGTTGYSTGCHLHFELIVNGQFTDPVPWLNGDPSIVDISTMGREVPPGQEYLDPADDPSTDPSREPGPSETPKPVVSETPPPPPGTLPGQTPSPVPSGSPSRPPPPPPTSADPTTPPSPGPSTPPPPETSTPAPPQPSTPPPPPPDPTTPAPPTIRITPSAPPTTASSVPTSTPVPTTPSAPEATSSVSE